METFASSGWFYTLSSIPQTLASVITLAATFVVFHLADTNTRIENHKSFFGRMLVAFQPTLKLKEANGLTTDNLIIQYKQAMEAFENDTLPTVAVDQRGKFVDNMMTQLSQERTDIASAMFYKDNIKNALWLMNDKLEYFQGLIKRKHDILVSMSKSIAVTAFTLILALFLHPAYGALQESAGYIEFALTVLAAFSVIISASTVIKIVKDN